MKIKKYKLVYDGYVYHVYTNDHLLKLMRDNSNGCHLGYVYLMPGECRWKLILRDIIDFDGTSPYYFNYYFAKPVKSKKKAVKNLVKRQNQILREMNWVKESRQGTDS